MPDCWEMGQAGPEHNNWQSSCRLVKETSSVFGCRWRTVWTQNVKFIISGILYRNFLTQFWNTAICSVKTGCFDEYNPCYVLHFVTVIILRYIKNIYKMCKFPKEYIDAIFIQIDQHLKKLLPKYKGVPILWNTVYSVSAQETAKHRAKFGWPPVSDVYMYIHFRALLLDRILHSPIFTLRPSLAFAYIGSVIAWGVSQTLRRGTRNGIMELSQRAPPIFGRAAITLGIGPHSS